MGKFTYRVRIGRKSGKKGKSRQKQEISRDIKYELRFLSGAESERKASNSEMRLYKGKSTPSKLKRKSIEVTGIMEEPVSEFIRVPISDLRQKLNAMRLVDENEISFPCASIGATQSREKPIGKPAQLPRNDLRHKLVALQAEKQKMNCPPATCPKFDPETEQSPLFLNDVAACTTGMENYTTTDWNSYYKAPRRECSPKPFGFVIRITNLDYSITEKDLKDLVEAVGPVVSVVLREPGCAEATFHTRQNALLAVQLYHKHLVGDLPLNVSFCAIRSLSSTELLDPLTGVEAQKRQVPQPNLKAVQAALFSRRPSSSPMFTVTLSEYRFG